MAARTRQWRTSLSEACRRHGTNLVVFDSIESTNGLGRRIAEEYIRDARQPPRTLVAAWEQTAGRGRQGRRWVSPAGEGLYASWVEPFDDPARKRSLPLITASALAGELSELLQARCLIRWPNDLLIDSRKIGGILIETFERGESGGAAIIGFGINHSHAAESVPDRAITSAAEVAAPDALSLPAMAGALIDALAQALDDSPSQDELVARYRSLSAHRRGDQMRVHAGHEAIRGIFAGFDELGRLRLTLEDGEERVIGSGEIDS